jgi:hypothetical protein
MTFEEWLRMQCDGCEVDLIQEDDGSGYYVLEVHNPAFGKVSLTVTDEPGG